MSNTNSELKKISMAFRRVKEDNLYLSTKLENMQEEMNYKINHLMQEIEVLRNKLNNEEKKTQIKKEVSSSDSVYIGNLTSKKIHVSNCPYAKKITPDNREIFDTLNEALRAKYVRCSCVANK